MYLKWGYILSPFCQRDASELKSVLHIFKVVESTNLTVVNRWKELL